MSDLRILGRGVSYPPSVVSALLQTTYMTSLRSARNLAPDKNPVDNKADIEALGGTVPANTGQVKLGSGTYTGWDWTGYQVMIDGDPKAVSFADCIFANQNYSNGLYLAYGQRLLAIGTVASTQGSNESVVCLNCEFDGQGSQPYGITTGGTTEGAVKTYGDLVMIDCWLHDPPKDHVTILGDNWGFTRCYFQCPAKVGAGGIYIAPPGIPQHVDNIHIYRGTGAFEDCFFDNWDGIATGITGSWTCAMASIQTLTGSGVTVNVTFNRCIQRGGATVIGNGHSPDGYFSGAGITYFCDAKVGTIINLTITNSVLDVGTTGKYSSVADARTNLTSTNNLNYTTGSPATLPGGP